ncbi:MAG: MATE family efflux transporter [Treponemataceae bacterium]|nr:MATE family efflux transporter [Treponemataceae bacterium]
MTQKLKESGTSENKMGVMPVGRLLVQMSLPMMISMLVQALYNIVDSIFVAQISEKALTAVSLAFPIQSLIIAVSTGTGVGINALLSKRLGQKDFQGVNKSAGNGVFLFIISFIVFIILGIIVPRPYFQSQTNDPEIVEYGVQYMTVILTVSPGCFMAILFERLLQSTGLTVLSMVSQLTGAIFNIIFDPILIFGYLGFPAMGITGAAVATVLGQIAAAIISIILNIKKNKEISFSLRYIKPDKRVIADIYKVGVPSILLASIGSVMTYFLNLILGSFSMTAVTIFGVYFKLQSFIFMPIFGMNNGLVPIIAYNFGAQKKKRIIDTIFVGIKISVGIMIIGTLVFELFPAQLLSLFNASDEMIAQGCPALRIIGIHFPIAAVCICLFSVFQALGQGVYSMIGSFVRQLIVLLPAAWLLSLTGSLTNVWWAFPIAEVSSLLTAFFFMKKAHAKYIKNMPD